MRIYQGQKDLMNSSERECLGKKPPREIGFLKALSSGLFYQVERHVNFSNKTKSSNLAHTTNSAAWPVPVFLLTVSWEEH